jgi:hypothetical protein
LERKNEGKRRRPLHERENPQALEIERKNERENDPAIDSVGKWEARGGECSSKNRIVLHYKKKVGKC